ncbi:MAG: histidine triad nucleotide-binding protein [Turneriella sp.]
MSECLFCKIAAKQIPAKVVYEDDYTLAFYDINPQAPKHLLLIPKLHLENILGLADDTAAHMLAAMRRIASEQDFSQGFRVVANTGEQGGQTVYHLHWHLLSGRHLGWPPG